MNLHFSSLLYIIALVLIIIVTATTIFVSADIFEAEVNNMINRHEKNLKKKQQSWYRWSVDWMQSVSGAVEELSNAADELVLTTKDPISGETRYSDPISSFASALTNIVGGSRESAAQMRTSMSAEERRKERVHRQKRQRGDGQESNMILEGNDDNDELDQQQRRKFLYGKKSPSFSERVIGQQKDLHERLFRHRQQQQGSSIATGSEEQLRRQTSSRRANKNFHGGSLIARPSHQAEQEEFTRRSSTESSNPNMMNEEETSSRSAQSLATTSSVDPDLRAARNSFNAFCRNGIVAVPFTPEMNFTCFNPTNPATSTKFTINGSQYSSSSFSARDRHACFPEETFLPKYCVCPFDKVLYRTEDTGVHYCFSYNYDCNMTIVDPAGFTEKKKDVIVNSLARGVPLRLPYVGTIDRRSSTPVTVSGNVKCLPIPEDPAASAGSGFEYLLPSQAAPANSSLVTASIPVGSTSVPVKMGTEANVTGSYTSLRGSIFDYYYNLTNVSAASIAAIQDVDADRNVISPFNYLFDRGLLYVRPHSFLDFANIVGSTTTTMYQQMTNGTGNTGGLLAGLQGIALSFVPSQLSDDFFTGGQLSVEFGYMLPFVTGLQPSTFYLSQNFLGKNTPLAELITFDVTNAPPPLPPAPPTPLETSTIVLIAIGAAAVLAGIIAIIVAIYRRQKAKEAKIHRKQERREMIELVRKEEEMKKNKKQD